MKLLIVMISALICLSAKAQTTGYSEAEINPPEVDLASPKVEATDYSRGSDQGNYDVRYANTTNKVVGFGFSNNGPNPVVPVATRGIGLGPSREFNFRFSERARQDIMISITDAPTEFFSHFMESYFYFFPRKVLPALQWPADPAIKTFTVILPTNEAVTFDKESHQMVDGVLKEKGPIDLGPDRFKRKFANIAYTGTGVYVRVDKRGNDPRFGTTATITQGAKTCKVPSTKLFDQNPQGAALFQFPTDEGFNEFLKKTCKMSFL